MIRMYAIFNDQASKPAQIGSILAHTGDSTLDSSFFDMGDGVLHSKGGLKRDWGEVNHGLEHLLTEEI